MKKFLIVTAIALGGVGIALGVSALLFSPASNKTEVETGGLIDDLETAEPEDTAKPKKSPKATEEPSDGVSSDGAGSGTAPDAAAGGSSDSGSDDPSGPSSQFVQNGVVVEASDHEDDPCADEDNEAERDACEDELEAEAEEEEEEAEADEDEDDDDD